MKNLKDLSINAKKVMNNEELVKLKGGYAIPEGTTIKCYDGYTLVGTVAGNNCYNPSPGSLCFDAFGTNCCDSFKCNSN